MYSDWAASPLLRLARENEIQDAAGKLFPTPPPGREPGPGSPLADSTASLIGNIMPRPHGVTFDSDSVYGMGRT